MELDELVVIAKRDPANNSKAMNEIVRRYQNGARIIAGRICFNQNDQGIVANTALMAVVTAVRAHDPSKDGLKSYIEITMVRAARRESMKQATDTIETNEKTVEAKLDKEAKRAVNPVDEYDPTDYGTLTPIVGELTEPQQTLLGRHYLDDLTVTEIAVIEGVTASAVTQRLATVYRSLLRSRSAAA
jgi:RNA polymerase sigma factor (sigma-70 family)